MPGDEWQQRQAGADSRWILTQGHTDSCAIACVAMVVNRVTESFPTERAVMNAVTRGLGNWRPKRPDGGYIPSAEDTINPHDPMVAGGDHVGTYMSSVPAYLGAYGIRCDIITDMSRALGNKLWEVTQRKPAILKVKPNGGGASHFIVVDGFANGTAPTNMGEWQLLVCDPEAGLRLGKMHYMNAKHLQVPGVKNWQIWEAAVVV